MINKSHLVLVYISVTLYFRSFTNTKFLVMIKTYESKIPYPHEVSEVSSETVQLLDDENYFNDKFDYPDKAKTLFYEMFASSLIKKFISGIELTWQEREFELIMVHASVEQSVIELEIMKVVDVFDDENGDKIIVMRKKKFPDSLK